MRKAKSLIFHFSLFSFLALGGLGGQCEGIQTEKEITPKTTECKGSMAQISIFDGFIQNHCGCTESAGQITKHLVCSVQSGATIVFHFSTAILRHQIVSAGSPALPESPLFDPYTSPKLESYGFILEGNSGDTFYFRDQFDPSIDGEFRIIP